MRLKIKRFLNNKSFYQEYDIEYKDDETILELLDRVRNNDRTLTYRSFCRSSICGTCAIKINNKTVLACKRDIPLILCL